MRYSAELAARATAWLARPLTNTPEGRRSAEGLLELATVWAAIQNVPLPACIRQCQYSDRVHDVNAYLREYARLTSSLSVMAEDTQQTATYQFKPDYAGQTLTADDYSKAVTADNLTDEDAEHFIKKGFGHVFQKIGAAVVAADEKLEGVGDGLADDAEAKEPSVQWLKASLEQVQEQYQQSENKVADYVESYRKQADALQSEKDAHATTKQQLSEVQQQLAEAQATITKLSTPKVKKVPADATPASTPVVADAGTSTTSSPTAGTDASADAATGSN